MARAALKNTGANDFTGGLNLGPPQEIALNEVAMARDVFFSARGGFNTRPGQKPFAAEILAPTGSGVSVVRHVHRRQLDGISQLFVIRDSDDELFWTSGGDMFDTGITVGSIVGIVVDDEGGGGYPIGINGTQYLDKSYFVQAYNQYGQEWDGYQMTNLGIAFDPDIAAPVPGNLPDATVIATFGDFLFVGDVREHFGDDAGTRQAGRVRWSHPGGPTSWREEDFVDVPEGRVSALVPFRDYLAVFTDDAIYGIYGDNSDNFQLQVISTASGTPFHGCVATSPSALYWWDWDQGVMVMGAGAPKSVFDKIKPFFDAGGFDSLNPDAQYPPMIFWGNGKLYVQQGRYDRNIRFADELGGCLVYDPAVGGGCWTSITLQTTNKAGGTVVPRTFGSDLVVVGSKWTPAIINDPTQSLDRNHLYDADDKQPPDVLVRTAPFEGDTNATKKRWRRPRVALRSASGRQEIRFGYLRNYYEGIPTSFHDIELDFSALLSGNSAYWDGGASWSDNFATENTFRWSGYSDSAISAAGNLQIVVNSTDGNEILGSAHQYDCHNVEVSINAVTPPTNSTMSFLLYQGNANVRFDVSTTTITMRWRKSDGSPSTVLGTFAYGASADWLRFTIDDVNITWSTSADGVTYTQRQQIPIPADFIANNILDAMRVELRAEQTSAGSTTAIFDTFTFTDTTDTVEGAGTWDTSLWAADLSDNPPPDNWIQFETLPSGGAGNVFQMEWRSITGGLLSADATNDSWGLDSIVLPYREKGVR